MAPDREARDRGNLSDSSKDRLVWQLAWIVPAVAAAIALVVWLLTMGRKGSDISGPLSLLVAILAFIFGISTWLSQRPGRTGNIRRPALTGLKKKMLLMLIVTLCVISLGTATVGVWHVLNKPDIQVTDLMIVKNGEVMHNGEQATALIPGNPPQREKLSLIPTLTNPDMVGDCAGPAQLQVELVVDGVPGLPLLSFPGDEINLDLKGVTRRAHVLITPYLQDSSCRVDLGVEKAVLHD